MNRTGSEISERKALRLLVALVLLLGIHPLFSNGIVGRLFLGATLTLILATSCLALSQSVRSRRAALGLASLALVGIVVNVLDAGLGFANEVRIAFPLLELLFLAYVISRFLTFVVGKVGTLRARLFGALAVYLLLGVAWSMAYVFLLAIDPSAIDLGGGVHDGTAGDLIYFSFVTLTTLGYGDILPVSSAARALAILEATTGTLFVAVMIASLVSAIPAADPE